MSTIVQRPGSVVNANELPPFYPTHMHDPKFWEALGRAIATFGFLEEVVGKAIFAFTGTREYPDDEIETAFERWLPTLERALSDPLGRLIDTYSQAVREHPEAQIEDFDKWVAELRQAAELRNVLCHGSWRAPDDAGQSVPLFVNRKNEIFDTPIDIAFLERTQRSVSELTAFVVSSVTAMGFKFPGSHSPGNPIID